MREEKITEMLRFFPEVEETQKENVGFFNLDINCFFPYSNQEVLTLGAGLFNSTLLRIMLDLVYNSDFEGLKNLMFKDVILNHRWPNRGYVSLTKKLGNKRCKTGYPICGTIEELNRFNLLGINLGIQDENFFILFPVKLNLSKDNPIGSLKVRIHDFEKSGFDKKFEDFGIDFETWQIVPSEIGKSKKCGKSIYYSLGKNRLGRVAGLPIDETRLEIVDWSENEYIFHVEPQIIIPGQPEDYFFL